MRRLLLPATLLLLMASTFFLWQHRFVRDPKYPTIRLADLKTSAALSDGVTWQGSHEAPQLVLLTPPPGQYILQRIPLPRIGPTPWLQVRCHVKASNLSIGPQPWSDGRLILEWHEPDQTWEFDPLASARHDQDPGEFTVIARPASGSAVPVLRLEHLGASGEFHILTFEATAVMESPYWNIGRWFLFAAWAALLATASGIAALPGHWRSLAAALIWLVFLINFALPGPWRTLRPLIAPFEIGAIAVTSAPSQPNTAAPAPRPPTPDPRPPTLDPPTSNLRPPTPDIRPPTAAPTPLAEAAGRISPKGTRFALIKDLIHRYCKPLKPLFHLPLLFAPTLLSLLLIGTRRSVILAIVSALAIEASQLAFGYGLDWIDTLDVSFDALGLLLALRVYHWLRGRGRCAVGVSVAARRSVSR